MKKFYFVIFGWVILLQSKLVFAQEDSNAVSEAAKSLENVAKEQLDTAKNLINMIVEFAVKYSFQVLGGIIVLVIGWLVARYVAKLLTELFGKKGIDVTVTKFMVGGVKLLIIGFAVIVALGKFGIEMAPLIAGISVIGFGTSFALQGPLSNYAAGITLIFTKPFKVGDIIEVAGEMGEVLDMKLARTDMRTVDGDSVVVPNKHIVGETIHNYGQNKRLDINVGVSYSADIDRAIQIVRDVVTADEGITKGKEPKIGISEFADSSVNIYTRCWCKQNDYWDTMFRINKEIFAQFKSQGIEIPFPQRDLHIVEDRTKSRAALKA